MADNLDAIRAALNKSDAIPLSEQPKPSFAKKYVLTPLGEALDVLDTDLNATTNFLRPLFTSLNPKLNEVYDNAPKKLGMPNVVPSDLIEKTFENTPGNKVLSKVLGFAADIAFSPSTYVAGVGVLTKSGKLFKKIKSISEAGESIGLESKLAKQIGAHYGEKPTASLIQKAVKEAKALGDVPSLVEQAKMGHRALINIGVPFTRIEKPFIKSQLFFRGMEETSKFLKSSDLTKGFFKLFSTSSGNPVFDKLRLSLISLIRLRRSNVQEYAVRVAKFAESASKEYGMDRNDFLKMVTDIVENPYRGDISAKAVLDTFTTDINKRMLEGIPVERIIRDLPGVDSMVMSEKMNLHNALLRNAKEQIAGFNVHTTGFLQLPEDVRTVFVKEWTDGIGIKFAKSIKQGKAEFADFAQVFYAYNHGINSRGIKLPAGVDAGMLALVGNKEYLRLLKHEGEYAKLAKVLAIPSGVGTEAAAMRDVVQRVVAHIDQGFATSYTLYKNAPKYLEQISPRMYKLQKLIDSKNDWKIKGLVEQFNIPLHLAKKYPKAFDLAQEYRTFLQSQLQLEKKAGVPISEFIGDISYIPHVPTEEARKLLEELYGDKYKGAVRDWNIDHLNTLAREFRVIDNRKVEELTNLGFLSRSQRKGILKSGDNYVEYLVKEGKLPKDKADQLYHYLTVSEVNNMASLGTLKKLQGRKITKFFEENPAQQIIIRGIRGEKARTAADFYEGIRQFGKFVPEDKNLPEGMKFLTNEEANPLAAIHTINGVNGKFAFDVGIADQINKVHRSLVLPAGSHPILNIFDRFQDEWKAWTLSIFPAYHTRNFIGNLWNNYLAGIHTPEPYLKALDIQRGKAVQIITGAGQKLTGEQVLGLAKKHGVLDFGGYIGDIERYFEADISHGIDKFYKEKIKPVPKFGLKVGGYVQNNANIALFVRRLEEGFSAAEAAMEVRKFQFDYRNITAFEKNVMKRVLPFYSWTRFNVPLQLEALFTHPQRLLAVQKGRNVLESNYDGVPDERLLPDYFVQNFPVRIRFDPKRKQYEYFLVNSWLPAADIDKLFNPVAFIKNNLTPFMKEPIQQIANRDFFTDQEIDSGDNYDTLNIFGKKISLPARIIHGAKNIRALTEIDRLSDPGLSTGGKWTKALTGKLYPFDETKQRRIKNFKYKERRAKLKSELKRANLHGDDAEAKRIVEKLKSISEERGREGS